MGDLYERLPLGAVAGGGGALQRAPQAHGRVRLPLQRRRRHDLQRAGHRVVAQVVPRLHTQRSLLGCHV